MCQRQVEVGLRQGGKEIKVKGRKKKKERRWVKEWKYEKSSSEIKERGHLTIEVWTFRIVRDGFEGVEENKKKVKINIKINKIKK